MIKIKPNYYYFLFIFLIYIISLCIITKHSVLNVSTTKNCLAEPYQSTNGIEAVDNGQKDLNKIIEYDISTIGQDFNFREDTIALLHIQKTGGSAWEKHILKHLQIKADDENYWIPACVYIERKHRHICLRNHYNKAIFWDRYLSSFCDIHADYTELKNCIMYEHKNRISSPFIVPSVSGIIHFMTFLRNPIFRYISEFEHVKQGASWQKAVRGCVHMPIYSNKCYNGGTWNNVTWEEFLTCDYNLGNNRQTRMLANYNILGCDVLKCWTKSSNCSTNMKKFYEQKILQSAKHTLISLAYFGLTEYQQLSEYLFLKTFNEDKFKFSESITTNKKTIAQKAIETDAAKYIEKIKENNHLDIQLYQFAKDLFFKRVSYFYDKDKQ